MDKPNAQIDDWMIVDLGQECCLIGRISGHPRQARFVMPFQAISTLLDIDLDQNRAETEHTIYTLLGPMPPELIPYARRAVGLSPEILSDAG